MSQPEPAKPIPTRGKAWMKLVRTKVIEPALNLLGKALGFVLFIMLIFTLTYLFIHLCLMLIRLVGNWFEPSNVQNKPKRDFPTRLGPMDNPYAQMALIDERYQTYAKLWEKGYAPAQFTAKA